MSALYGMRTLKTPTYTHGQVIVRQNMRQMIEEVLVVLVEALCNLGDLDNARLQAIWELVLRHKRGCSKESE